MSGGRSKRSAASVAESRISKFVKKEKNFERNSRLKKSKYDLDDYFDDTASVTSSEDSDSQPLLTQKCRNKGKMHEKKHQIR